MNPTAPKSTPQIFTNTSQEVSEVAQFPVPNKKFCSLQVCKAGHEWVPQLMAVKCPGCQAPILALMMVNCPICNEPSAKSFLRMDHLAQGGGIMPLCKGGGSLAEVIGLEVEHNHAQTEEANYVVREVISKA